MKPLSTGSTSNTNGDGTQQNNNDKLGEHLGSLASETPEYKIKKSIDHTTRQRGKRKIFQHGSIPSVTKLATMEAKAIIF